jgi:hypothetical protein
MTTDTRNQIKSDLCNYFTQTAKITDKEVLKKAVCKVKSIAEELGDDSFTMERLANNFSPTHRVFLLSIINRLQVFINLEYEEYASENDGFADRVETVAMELDQHLGMHRFSYDALHTLAAKIVENKMSFDEAFASLTSKKPVLIKR